MVDAIASGDRRANGHWRSWELRIHAGETPCSRSTDIGASRGEIQPFLHGFHGNTCREDSVSRVAAMSPDADDIVNRFRGLRRII